MQHFIYIEKSDSPESKKQIDIESVVAQSHGELDK